MRKLTTVSVDRRNYERLQKLGKVPETFNTIIGRLLDHAEKEMEK